MNIPETRFAFCCESALKMFSCKGSDQICVKWEEITPQTYNQFRTWRVQLVQGALHLKAKVKVKVKVKFSLEQATKAQRGSSCIALLFLQPRRYMGMVVNATPRPLYPRERPGTHCIGGWVGPRAGLDGCGKSRPQPVASRYTDWAIPAPTLTSKTIKNFQCLLIKHWQSRCETPDSYFCGHVVFSPSS